MGDRRVVAAEQRLRLLGSWRLDVDGLEVRLGGREQRLASLLALHGRRARLQVAGILWPESTDARALASLRRALLLTQQRSPGLISADRSTVGLDPSVRVDVDGLRAAIEAVGGDFQPEEAPALLAALSSGDLLPGWYDDWLIPEREQLAQSRVRALVRIARRALEADDLTLAVEAAEAASATEPLLESAREVAIRAHLGRGDTGFALREYAGYRDVLRDELGVAPSHAITGLVERLVPGNPDTPSPAAPTPVAALRLPRPRASVEAPVESVEPVTQPVTQPVPEPVSGPVTEPVPEPVTQPVTESSAPGTAGPIARILALATTLLVVAAWLAVLGLDRGRGAVDGGESAPARPAPSAGSAEAAVQRRVLVSSGGTASGGVRFLMRATPRPTEVRLVVLGPSGTSVVRSVVVRRAEGHRIVLDHLDPGDYTWAATSTDAPSVSGQVTVAPAEVAQAAGPTPTPRPAPTASASAAAAPAPVTPSVVPVVKATATPSVTPSTAPPTQPPPSPSTSSPTRQPSPTHHAKPRGRPTDPGTQAPTPVG